MSDVDPMFQLGDQVLVTGGISKTRVRKDHGPEVPWGRRFEDRTEWPEYEREPVPGFVVGKRTVYEGIVDYDRDYGNSFYQDRAIIVYLVATHLRLKPTHHLPTQLQHAPQEPSE